MYLSLLPSILDLNPSDRIRLAQAILESVCELPDAGLLTSEQRIELDQRLSLMKTNPDSGIWLREVIEELRVAKQGGKQSN